MQVEDNRVRQKLNKAELVIVVIGTIPILLLLASFFVVNFIGAPNHGKIRLAKARAAILAKAINSYIEDNKKKPGAIEDLASYIKKEDDQLTKKADPQDYFSFALQSGNIESRNPKGKTLQAGFGKLSSGEIIIVAIGPGDEPVSWRSEKYINLETLLSCIPRHSLTAK
jgi:hypothetical protein